MPRMTPSFSNAKSRSSTSSTPATSATSPSTQDPKFDLFAQKFIPAWLKNVNSFPLLQLPFFSSPPEYTDFEGYAQSFLPSPLYRSCVSTKLIRQIQSREYALDVHPFGAQIPFQHLGEKNYSSHFRNALIEERRAIAEEWKQYNLYEVRLEPYGIENRQRDMYKLNVPGLREYIPNIFVGDSLIIRTIRVSYSGVKLWDNCEYIAYISAIDRMKEFLIVKLPDLARVNLLLNSIPNSFNVQFNPRNTIETYQMLATDLFSETLQTTNAEETYTGNWAQRMLFPTKDHAKWLPERELGLARFDIDFVDKDLNYEQQKAVWSIINEIHGDLPFLVSGPPGTGKTKTVIEAILQLVTKGSGEHVRILAVAPSASAADTIALRLRHHLAPGELFRLNDISRTFAEVPTDLLLYCSAEPTYFSLPPFEKLMNAKVVVTDCMSSFELIKARCTNKDIYPLQELYTKAFNLNSGSQSAVKSWHWTHLFIDEAAQAREPETLIPLFIVAPSDIPELLPAPKLILAGDANQLGPLITSPIARSNGLDISLFERLLLRPIYSQHPLSRQNAYKKIIPKGEGWYRPAFVNLVRNYRSHEGILMMPSGMFYNSTLIPEAKDTISLLGWKDLPNSRIPVLFHPCYGEELWIQDTSGWYNREEIKITCNYVASLLGAKNYNSNPVNGETLQRVVQQREIAVIVPFREHVVRLRLALRKRGFADVGVGTVENYQGGERRITILNVVRSTPRFLEWDIPQGRGLVCQKRRFNVAITRAKELLIIIGNPKVLEKDIYWRAYLSFVKRNGLCRTEFEFDDDRSGRWISSLERAMKIRDEVFSGNGEGRGVLGGGWNADVFGEEWMWNVGAVLEKLVLEEEEEDEEQWDEDYRT